MKNSVYLVSGQGLPTKLAVVSRELDLATLFDIENRFLTGHLYTQATPVHRGVIQLQGPGFGPHDQAYFPGNDVSSTVTEDGSDAAPEDGLPGRVLDIGDMPEDTQVAYLVSRRDEAGVEYMVVILPTLEGLTADVVVQSLAGKQGNALLSAQLIGSGTFEVGADVVRQGFTVCIGSVITK